MKALAWMLAILVLLAAAAVGGRTYATRAMSSRAVAPKALGSQTPADAALPFSRVAIPSGDRTLIGWWVRAEGADTISNAPAVLLLHGNRASISDLVPVQRFLHRQGISSLVFDYSGFGASGGQPSFHNAVVDAAAAARTFADSAGGARKIAMGTALGAAVLLQAIDGVQPYVDGVIIEGVPASVKESAVRDGRLPRLIAPLVEDVGDNVTAARRVRVPLLAIHSHADNRFPFADAERVVDAVPGRAALVRHWRPGHSALLSSSRPCDWAPVLTFVRAGTLPPAKIDTTNACAIAEAAEKARSDSIAAARAAAEAAAAAAKAPTTKAPTTKAPTTKAPTTKAPTTKAPATKTPPARTPAKRP